MIFASETAQASGGGMGVMLIWIVALVALMYFMMIRPQKKEQKRMQAMLSDLAVGDAVVTNSGFYGIVIDISEEDVIVEFGNTKRYPQSMPRYISVDIFLIDRLGISGLWAI